MDATDVTRDEHGWIATRSALLIGVSASASGVVYAAIQDALLTSNNYNFGQAHPTMTALYCSAVRGRAVDRDKVQITCDYRPYSQLYNASATQTATLSMGTSVQSTQTNLDNTGATMVINPSATSVSQTQQSGLASVDKCITSLVFKRKEPSLPNATVQSMVNTINQYNCNISGITYAPKTLKLERIQSDLSDNGNGTNAYMVTYEFTYLPLIPSGTFAGYSQWQATLVFQDPQNGNIPPKDASLSDGSLKVYDIYNTADFSTLYLW